jgi:hypothetical protein
MVRTKVSVLNTSVSLAEGFIPNQRTVPVLLPYQQTTSSTCTYLLGCVPSVIGLFIYPYVPGTGPVPGRGVALNGTYYTTVLVVSG